MLFWFFKLSACKFTARKENTPTIDGLEKQAQPAGEMVKMTGNIVTAYRGSTILSENSTNGVTARITRIWVCGRECLMEDGNGDV